MKTCCNEKTVRIKNLCNHGIFVVKKGLPRNGCKETKKDAHNVKA